MQEKKSKKQKSKVKENASKGRDEALKSALAQIEKQFGKGSIMKLGESSINTEKIEVIPTGSLSLDVALGAGGIPKGRIIEIYGPESSGKTTVALHIVSEVQKAGGIAGFVDAEHALDPIYAKKLGVNIDELYISQPDDGEQALDITETMVRSGAIDVIIVDSVAALVPKAEIDGVMGDSHLGLHARLMSQALRKLTSVTAKSKSIVIFINQLREKIGAYGNPETTTGGKALKFYASIRIDVRKGEAIKIGTEIIGSRTKAKIVKNKIAPPFKLAEFDIIFGEGISTVGDILDLAAELDIVHKGGSWYSYGEVRLGQGRENAKKYLKENISVCREIENAVRTHYNMPLLEDIQKNIENSEVISQIEEQNIENSNEIPLEDAENLVEEAELVSFDEIESEKEVELVSFDEIENENMEISFEDMEIEEEF